MSTVVRVAVPATSANLGPGYDCAGLALDLVDELSATLSETLVIEVTGEGADDVPLDDSHLVVRSIARTFAAREQALPGLHLTCTNRIPHGRGLGSSSAAIVAGVLLGRGLLGLDSQQMPDAELLAIATEIEGHPDNVAPALLGGLTLAWLDSGDGAGRAVRLEPSARLQPVVAIPREKLATQRARELIPVTIGHAAAAANAGRAALLSTALTGRTDLLMVATEDRLHQEFRRFAYPDSYALMAGLRSAGIPAMISGAGPTVIALGVAESESDGARVAGTMAQLLADAGSAEQFHVVELAVDVLGARQL